MKNLIFTLLAICTLNLSGQEKIADFKTSTASLLGFQETDMNINFELYDDRLVLNYLDKSMVRALEKTGQPSYIEFPYGLKRESNEMAVWYKYQDETIQIMVMLEGNPRKSVTIKTIDDFTNEVTSNQLYY